MFLCPILPQMGKKRGLRQNIVYYILPQTIFLLMFWEKIENIFCQNPYYFSDFGTESEISFAKTSVFWKLLGDYLTLTTIKTYSAMVFYLMFPDVSDVWQINSSQVDLGML